MGITITIIYDNCPFNPALYNGFGFSCLIEYEDKKIIFDTGGDKIAFFHNIGKLQINLNNITHIMFSHQHWDHTAGFKEITQHLNNSCVIYVPFKFDKQLLRQIPKEKEVIILNNTTKLEKNIFSVVLKGSSCVVKECFTVYEQSLVIENGKDLIVLTGCAHAGIKNILKTVQTNFENEISWVIGGFHLCRSFNKKIIGIIDYFNSIHVKNIVPCHCTGENAIRLFKSKFNGQLYNIGAGALLCL